MVMGVGVGVVQISLKVSALWLYTIAMSLFSMYAEGRASKKRNETSKICVKYFCETGHYSVLSPLTVAL